MNQATTKTYVYLHILDAEVIYVGCGREGRMKNLTARNSRWATLVGKRQSEIVVAIAGTYDQQEQALAAERDLIERWQPAANVTHNAAAVPVSMGKAKRRKSAMPPRVNYPDSGIKTAVLEIGSIRKTAEIAGVSYQSVTAWLNNGYIPIRKDVLPFFRVAVNCTVDLSALNWAVYTEQEDKAWREWWREHKRAELYPPDAAPPLNRDTQ